MDRLAGVTLPDSTAIAYTYDVDGRRITQSANGQTTHYLWDETSPYGDVILESDGAGMPIVSYTLAHGELISQTRSGATSFYLTDGQHSTRSLADESGAVTDTYRYDAFGELDGQTGSTANSYLYTGQQFDGLTGLYSLRARHYDPGVGRFLSQDAAAFLYSNPIQLNRYTYVANSPISRIDPSGNTLVENIGGNSTSFRISPTLAVMGKVAAIAGFALVANHIQCTLLPDPVIEETCDLPSGEDLIRWYQEQLNKPKDLPGPWAPPFPDPAPTAGVTPTQPPTPTPSPTPSPKQIALGVGDHLIPFTRELRVHLGTSEVYYYDEWPTAGLVSSPDNLWGAQFNLGFREATSRAIGIHFNLQDLEPSPKEYATAHGSSGWFSTRGEYFTAIELYLIMNDPVLCNKTTFYRYKAGGALVEVPNEKLEICGTIAPMPLQTPTPLSK